MLMMDGVCGNEKPHLPEFRVAHPGGYLGARREVSFQIVHITQNLTLHSVKKLACDATMLSGLCGRSLGWRLSSHVL